MGFYLLQSERAVGTRARHDDADGMIPGVVRQRAEEAVDGKPWALLLSGHNVKCPVHERQLGVRWNHVNPICLHLLSVLRVLRGNGGVPRDEFWQGAGVVGGEMDDYHERHARILRYVLEERTEGINGTSRGTDADDKEGGLLLAIFRFRHGT